MVGYIPQCKSRIAESCIPNTGNLLQPGMLLQLIHLVTQKAVSFEWAPDVERAPHQVQAAVVLGPWALRSRPCWYWRCQWWEKVWFEVEGNLLWKTLKAGLWESGARLCHLQWGITCFLKNGSKNVIGSYRNGILDQRMLIELPIMS